MALPRFEVLQPSTVEEACGQLAQYKEQGAVIIAGGTDILVNLRRPLIPAHLPRCQGCDPVTGKSLSIPEKIPKYLIALSRIEGLKGINEETDGSISIGSMTTINEICKSELVRKKLTALAEGGDNLGSPLVRNRGTIGGNICNARPAADLLIPTYALKGELEIASPNGKRVVAIQDIIINPGKTIIKANEVVTKISYPTFHLNTGSSAIKLANRKALEIAVVNVAVMIALDKVENRIIDVRIVLGAVGPKPIIAQKTQEYLTDREAIEAEFAHAGEIASGECRPITDHRGSALYRLDMVKILVKRALMKAVKRI
jgi:carbon-monoxide dehydrogenase medium subunit